METKGQVGVWAFALMLGITVVILALALAPSGQEIVDDTMNASSTTYKYYETRDWTDYNVNLTNGEYIMNETELTAYQSFTFPKLDGEYFIIENMSLKLKRVGNPTGNVTIRISEGSDPYNSKTVNFTTQTLEISTIGTSFENTTFDLPTPENYMKSSPYYFLSVKVGGVDSSNYLVVGTTNITNFLGSPAKEYNLTAGSSSTIENQLNKTVNLLFKYTLRDGGVETLGLDCENPNITSFYKGTCVITDFSMFYFFAALILIGGAIIIARIIL